MHVFRDCGQVAQIACPDPFCALKLWRAPCPPGREQCPQRDVPMVQDAEHQHWLVLLEKSPLGRSL